MQEGTTLMEKLDSNKHHGTSEHNTHTERETRFAVGSIGGGMKSSSLLSQQISGILAKHNVQGMETMKRSIEQIAKKKEYLTVDETPMIRPGAPGTTKQQKKKRKPKKKRSKAYGKNK